MPKMNVNLYFIEDYENEPPSVPKKQTQFKPNLVRRRRIPKGQNRLPKNLATPNSLGCLEIVAISMRF